MCVSPYTLYQIFQRLRIFKGLRLFQTLEYVAESKICLTPFCLFLKPHDIFWELGSVAGPVIQANRRLTFEDDSRSGGLLCFISMNASVRIELADSMVTPGEPGDD